MNYFQKHAVVGAIVASLTVSVLGITWYNQKNLLINKSRSNAIVRCRSKPISKEKIIFAFDPQNLFVNFSEIKKQGYKLLRQKSNGLRSLVFKRFDNRACCYRQRISSKSIRHFMKKIKQIPNVEVVIYTKIQQQYCNQMLQNIGILHLFPEENKYFNKNRHKSPQEIDCDTGRVIIITANQEDQRDEFMSNHHNLVLSIENEEMDENLLFRLQQYLQRLASLGRTDTLHEQMYDLALEMRIPLCNYQSMVHCLGR